jgi:hypothetical protein
MRLAFGRGLSWLAWLFYLSESMEEEKKKRVDIFFVI